MIYLKTPEQIAKMRDAGALLHQVLTHLKEAVAPGMSTLDLDAMAEALIRKGGAIPSFLGYHDYPATLCTSIDDEVVHGIPSRDRILKDGMIVSIDCGLVLDGWQADSALTVGIGEISAEATTLIELTETCFWQGVRQAVNGKRLGDIGHAVQSWAEGHGCGVVRDLTGHGIGRELHEDPPVYNFGEPGKKMRLRPGMTLAVEPMITAGDWQVQVDDDQWCYRTVDGSLCAHYEHTIAINEEGLPDILTLPGFTWKEEA